jgi:hypothetical protein
MESVDDTIAMFHTVENLQKLLADLHTVRSVSEIGRTHRQRLRIKFALFSCVQNCASMTQAFEAPLLIRKPSESSLGSPRTAVQPDQPRTLPFISKRLLKELASFVETVCFQQQSTTMHVCIFNGSAAA